MSDDARSNLATVIAVAAAAYAACDMTHEVVGHGLACLAVGVRPLSLSTVALQTGTSSRYVAAAGSIANVVVGAIAMFVAGRARSWSQWRWSASRYFLWLFAATNLLNGTGYLLFSGVLGLGDWSVVIAGLEPGIAWRVGMALAGTALYVSAIRWIVAVAVRFVRTGLVGPADIQRLVFPAYIAGGVLFVAGSALNRIDPSLIFTSGLSSGFGAMAGLAAVPAMVERRTAGDAGHAAGGAGAGAGRTSAATPLPFSIAWVLAGALIALTFIFLLGPGIPLA